MGERNYLEVYPYDKWTDSAEIAPFVVGDQLQPEEFLVSQGTIVKGG